MVKITAFSFLKISKGHLNDVVESIKDIPQLRKLYVLTGDYDALIELEVDDPQELFDIWVQKLDQIEGITETNTHIAMKRVEL
jgi:DNA-binding Lrp family transcriptional regulator